LDDLNGETYFTVIKSHFKCTFIIIIVSVGAIGGDIAIDVHIIVVDAAFTASVIVGDVIRLVVVVVVVVVVFRDKSVLQRNLDVSCRCSTRNDDGFKYTDVKNNDGIFLAH